jgi:hypothetical protein
MAVAESALLASAVTQGMFNTNIIEFVSGVTEKGFRPGTDGSYVLTLPELLGIGPGGVGGNYSPAVASAGGLTKVVKDNVMNNGLMLGAQLIGIPIAFRIGTKLLKKPRSTANKLLREVGLDGVRF